MKVALVVPDSPIIFDGHAPPTNIGYIAAYLQQQMPDVEVKFFDGTIDADVYESISLFKPDVVGVTAVTQQALGAYRLLDKLKKSNPQIITVMGGIHASALPEEASIHADHVVVGDGEIAFCNIIKNYMSNLKSEKIIEGTPIKNIDDLPFPYDIIHVENYIYFQVQKFPELRLPLLRMTTSRGCIYKCPFCYNSTKRNILLRYHTAERIIQELTYIVENYGIRSVWFQDDEFLVNKKRLHKFINLFKTSGLSSKLTWGCQARVDSINDEVIQLIKKNGCVILVLGIESTTAKSLSYLKCNTVTKADIDKAMDICYKYNMRVRGSFIFGSPNETLVEIKETWNWIRSRWNRGLTHFDLGILTPFPGTRVWLDWHNRPSEVNYEKIGQYIINTSMPTETFLKFMAKKRYFIWMTDQLMENGFFKLAKHKSFWQNLTQQPKDLLRILVKSFGERSNSICTNENTNYEEFTQLTKQEAELYNQEHRNQKVRTVIPQYVKAVGGSILDACCGNGIDTQNYPAHLYLGVDISPSLIAVAKQRNPTYKYDVVDCRNLPFPNNSFDNVIIKSALEHVPSECDAAKIFQEALRVCKKQLIIAWHTPPVFMRKSKIRCMEGHFGKSIHQNTYKLQLFKPFLKNLHTTTFNVDNFTVWVLQK